MQRVLIAGGAGFIGSHLCELFLNKGFELTCVDNFITGSLENIAQLSGKRLKLIRHDISQPLDMDEPIDYVLNFASPASPVDYMQHPIETMKVGAYGTHNLLELAKDKGAIFFLASTSEVYGDPLIHPQKEDYWGNVNPIGPRAVYDEAKRFAEAMTMAYHRIYKLSTRIVRIFNVFGDRMRPKDGRAIPNFICQALNDEPITVYGDGSQTRSFCFVSDEVEGIYRLLMSDIVEPVNIGNPEEMTVLQLAKKIIELTESKSQIVFKPLPEDDPKVRKPDITKARQLLGWEPKVSLEEGLRETIEYFKELKKKGKL